MTRWIPLAALFLAGCAGTIPGVSQQGVAGITDVRLEWCEPAFAKPASVGQARPASADAPKYLCGLRWRDGKEKQNVSLEIELPTGARLTYSATGVRAFKAHEVRAAVEQAISEDVRAVMPNIVDIIVDALATL